MIRKAIIVASPLTRGQRGFLPGVEMDVENYKSFLTSPVGGSWSFNEIQVLWNPTSTKITQVMNAAKADYVFTAYSGHGGHDKRTGKEFLQINGSEAVWLTHLTANGSKRQLAVIDACSTYMDSGISGFEGPAPITFTSNLSSDRARKIFDYRVSSSENGWTVIHSASPGQASIDTEEGGFFSRSLLQSVSNWGKKYEANSILPVPIAYQHSFHYLKKVFRAEQTPRIWHSESKPVFPFALRYGTELTK